MHFTDYWYHTDHLNYPKGADLHDLPTIYKKVLSIILTHTKDSINEAGNTRHYSNRSHMSDREVINPANAAEYIQISSANLLWPKLGTAYTHLFRKHIQRISYNRRKKALRDILLCCTEIMASQMVYTQEAFLIDSIPMPSCRIVREYCSKACRRPEKDAVVANKGFNRILGGYFIGYKMHTITSETGVYRDLLLTPASTHDSSFHKQISPEDTHLYGRTLIGDRGYIMPPS